MNLFLIVLAVLGGVAVTLQGQLMGQMDRAVGTRESLFITYAGGGLVAALLLLGARGGNLRMVSSTPWYFSTTGLLGLVIVGSLGYTVPRLGLTPALTVVTVSQFAVAAVIDHFGWLGAAAQPFGLMRLAGLGLMVAGVWLVTR